jgi:integrase/recombinase XerC
MSLLKWFIKLMKNEPIAEKEKKHRFGWVIDESKCFTVEEIKKLKTFYQKEKKKGLWEKRFTLVRNWFMLELGLNAGLRVAEMASLKHGNLLIEQTHSSIVVVGKGNKKRSVWISSDFKKTCETFLGYKKEFGYEINDESYLLNNNKGNKITKRSLQKFFKENLEKAELPKHYYIHCLRHTFATFLLKASNYNYRFVQDQLGHASIRTTQIYASVLESDGRRAVEKLYK